MREPFGRNWKSIWPGIGGPVGPELLQLARKITAGLNLVCAGRDCVGLGIILKKVGGRLQRNVCFCQDRINSRRRQVFNDGAVDF